ncbi:hypothetical protein A3K72_00905 [Candidatus Woesearchaeota archaeon RBG_13_36_6]|nr:MAG: hypothetical protein A3K72_00905 [Candidatus Woesearchaeota archaeon RBG_13_36_6]
MAHEYTDQLGEEAREKLRKIYISKGVDPEIAQECVVEMSPEELAGFEHPPFIRINPDLEETKKGLESLILKGIDSDAAAILLTKISIRAYYSRARSSPYIGSTIEEQYRSMMQTFHDLCEQLGDSIEAARRIHP